jgi:hypothetical protein
MLNLNATNVWELDVELFPRNFGRTLSLLKNSAF